MNWVGGGFVPVINYAGSGGAVATSKSLLTESGNEILAEDGSYLEYEP